MTIMAERPTVDFARALLVRLAASNKKRRVRTPEGSDLYGQPIGTIITADMLNPSVKSLPQLKGFPSGTVVTQTSSKGKETHYTKQKDGTWKSSATGYYGQAGQLGPAIVSGQLTVKKLPGEVVDQEDFDAAEDDGEEPTAVSEVTPEPTEKAVGTPGEPVAEDKPLGIVDLVNMPPGSRIAVTNDEGTAHFTKSEDGNWLVDGAVEGDKGHHSTAFKKYADSQSIKIAGAQPGTKAAEDKATAALDDQEKKAIEAVPGEPKVLNGPVADIKDLSAVPEGTKMYRTSAEGTVDEFTKSADDAWKVQGGSFAYGSSIFKADIEAGRVSWDSPLDQTKQEIVAPPPETIADDGSEPIPTGIIGSVADLDAADPGSVMKNVSGTSEFVKQENGNWKSTATKKERPSSYFEPAVKNGAMEWASPAPVEEAPAKIEGVDEKTPEKTEKAPVEAPAKEAPVEEAKSAAPSPAEPKLPEEKPADVGESFYKDQGAAGLTKAQQDDLAMLDQMAPGTVVWVQHGTGGAGQVGQYKHTKQEDGSWKPSAKDGTVSAQEMLTNKLAGKFYPWVQQSDKPKSEAGPKEPYKSANSPKVAELDALPTGTKIQVKHPVKGMGAAIYTYKKNADGTWRTLKDNMGVPDYTKPYNKSKANIPSTDIFIKGNSTYTVTHKPETPPDDGQGAPPEPAPDAPAGPEVVSPTEAAPEAPTPVGEPLKQPVSTQASPLSKVGEKIENAGYAAFQALPAGSKVEGLNGSTITKQTDGSWKHDRTGKTWAEKDIYGKGSGLYKLHTIGDGTVAEPVQEKAPEAETQAKTVQIKAFGETHAMPEGTHVYVKEGSDLKYVLDPSGKWYRIGAGSVTPKLIIEKNWPVFDEAVANGVLKTDPENAETVPSLPDPYAGQITLEPTPIQQADDALNFAQGESAKSLDLPPNGFNKKKYKAGSKITVSFTNDWGSKTTKTLTLQENGKWVQKNEGKKDNVWSSEFIEGRDDATITEHHVEYADDYQPPKSTDMAQSKPQWWENGTAVPSTLKQLDELPPGSVIHDNYDDPYVKQENGKWKNPQGNDVPTSVFNDDIFNGQVALVSLGEGGSVKKVVVHQGLDKGEYDVPAGSKVYHLKSATSESANTKYIMKPDGSWWKASQGTLEFKGHPWITGDNSLAKGFFTEDTPDPNYKPAKKENEPYTQEEFDALPVGTKVSWIGVGGSKATYTKNNDSDYWQEDGTGNSLYMPTEVYIGYVYPYSEKKDRVVSKTKTIQAGPHEYKIPQSSKPYYLAGLSDHKYVENADGGWTIYLASGLVQQVPNDDNPNNTDAIEVYKDMAAKGEFTPVGELPKPAQAAPATPESAPETPVAPGGVNAVIFKDKAGTTHYAPAGTKLYEVPGPEYKYAEFPDGTWKQYKGEAEGPITLDSTTIEILKKLIADGDTVQPVNAVPEKLHPSGLKPGKYTKIGGHGKVFMLVNADGTAVYIDKSGNAKPLGTKGVLGYHKNGFTNWSAHTGEAIPVPGSNEGTPKTPKAKKGELPDYSGGGEFPNPFSKPPDLGYSPSVHEITAQVVRLAEESGFKNIAGLHRSGMTTQEKKDWLKHWYEGDWDKAYEIELKAAVKNDKNARVKDKQELIDAPAGTKLIKLSGKYQYEFTKGDDGRWRRYEGSYGDDSEVMAYDMGNLVWPDKVKHAKATQHPGSPDNPVNANGFTKINIAPMVPGEKKAGTLGHLAIGTYVNGWSEEEIDNYMYQAGMTNAHGMSKYEKQYWTDYHVKGNQIEVDKRSLIAKNNVDKGYFQSEPIGPQPDPVFAGESVPDFTPGKPFNTGSSHANNLTADEVDAYLTPLFSKKAAAALKGQPIEIKRAIVQLHFLTTVPTTDGAYKTKNKATEDYNALHESIENQVKNSSYGSTISLHVDNPKPVTSWSYAKDQPNYKGAFEKFDVEDDTGTAFLFKPTKGGDPYRAEVAHYAHEIAHLMGYKTAKSWLIKTENKNGEKVFGQAQAKFLDKDGNSYPDLKGVRPEDLTEKQILGIAGEHVLDWAINQDDTHSENLFVTPDGGIIGIDKDRAFAFFGTQELKRGKFQHKSVVEQQYYEAFYKAIADGKIDPATVQKAYKVAMQNARRIEKVDDEKYRALLEKAFANNKKLNDASRKQLIDDVIARKNNMSKDFDEFWTGLLDEAGIAKPDTKLPMAPGLYGGFSNPELMDDVRKGRIWGHSTFFAGQDIEDGHLLLWEEQGANGGPPVLYGQGQILKSGDDKFVQWLQDNYNGPDNIGSANNDAGKVLKNKATYDEKITRGIKDIRRKLSGKTYQDSNIAALTTMRVEMENYLNNSVYETDYPNQPKKQAAHKEMLEEYIAVINAAIDADLDGEKPAIFTPYNYVWQDEDKIDLEPTPKLGYKITKRSSKLNVATVDEDTNTLTDTGTESAAGQTGYDYVIELEDGTEVIYRPWGNDSGYYGSGTHKSHQGTLRFRNAKGHSGEITGKRVQDFLKEVGLEAEDPDEEDLELLYWRSLYGIMDGRNRDKNTGDQAKVIAAVQKDDPRKYQVKSDEIARWREVWGEYKGQHLVDKFVLEQGYLPQFSKTTIQDKDNGHGRPYWNRFDVDINKVRLEDEFLARSQFGLYGGDSPAQDSKIMIALKSGGIIPVMERARTKGYWHTGSNGGSGDTDSSRGSGSFTFVRQNQENTQYHIYFDPAVMARTSTYSFASDSFGNLADRSSSSYFDFDKHTSHSAQNSNEAVIKNGVSILSDAVLVVFYSAPERQKALDLYKSHGIYDINGVPLEEVFVTKENRQAGLKAAHARMKARVEGSGYDPANSSFTANMPTAGSAGTTVAYSKPKKTELVEHKSQLDDALVGTEVYDKGAPQIVFTKLPNGMWDHEGDSYPSSQFAGDDGVVQSYKWGNIPLTGTIGSVDDLKDAPEGTKIINDGSIYTKTEAGPDGVWESATGTEYASVSFGPDVEEGLLSWITESVNPAGSSSYEMGDTVSTGAELFNAPSGATIIINPPAGASDDDVMMYSQTYSTVTKQSGGGWTDMDGDFMSDEDLTFYMDKGQIQWINPNGYQPVALGSNLPQVGGSVTEAQMEDAPTGFSIKSKTSGKIYQKAPDGGWYKTNDEWDSHGYSPDEISLDLFVWHSAGMSAQATQTQQQNAANDNPAAIAANIVVGYEADDVKQLDIAPAGSVISKIFQNGNATEFTKTSDGFWEAQFTGDLVVSQSLWDASYNNPNNPAHLQWKEIGDVDPDWADKLMANPTPASNNDWNTATYSDPYAPSIPSGPVTSLDQINNAPVGTEIVSPAGNIIAKKEDGQWYSSVTNSVVYFDADLLSDGYAFVAQSNSPW